MAVVGERVSAARDAAVQDLLLTPVAHALTAESGTEGFGFENIVGVGVPFPALRARPDNEEAIAVYVARKAPVDLLEANATVPSSYEGVPTEVVEAGEFVSLTEKGRYRPASLGVSVGHVTGQTGSLGFLARRGEELMIVSNNHVLARENAAERGDLIIQPGRFDGGRDDDRIAALADFINLDFGGGLNPVDAASGIVASDDVTQDLFNGGPLVPIPAGVSGGVLVRKCGRTTGLTHGIVSDLEATIRVRYPGGHVLLSEQILVEGLRKEPFSAPGDSGSLVVAEPDNRPVAMVCGGSPKFTVANRIGLVLEGLGVSFGQ
jgi:hypothetical protein